MNTNITHVRYICGDVFIVIGGFLYEVNYA